MSLHEMLLRLAESLSEGSQHVSPTELQAAVFSSAPPFEGHLSECELCQGFVLRERDRNPLYKFWLQDPEGFAEALEAIRCKESSEK
jgi:hypothetical protein